MIYDKQAVTYPITQLHLMYNSTHCCMMNKQEITQEDIFEGLCVDKCMVCVLLGVVEFFF
jgi:hypothetical protein